MALRKKFTWLVSPKSFIQLIGAEYELLKKSGSSSLVKFYVSAVSIVLILLVSACSIFYAMELLFHMLFAELAMSVFISVLFVFIYIFLLNTFSKNVFLPSSGAYEKKWYQRIKLADSIRTGFVVFMAFMISKPIEVFLFRQQLDQQVAKNRVRILSDYTTKLDSLNIKDISKMERSIAFYEKQFAAYPSPVLEKEISGLRQKIMLIQTKQALNLRYAAARINQTDFLLYRIKVISHNTSAWIICAIMICLFLLPGFLIYSISAKDAYYKLKKESEVNMVLEEYYAFEKQYSAIFLEVYQLDRKHYSNYEDPPINTIRKKGPSFNSQADFLNNYSSD